MFLFGHPKTHKTYQEEPIQCSKCFKLGHTSKYYFSSDTIYPNFLGNHPFSSEIKCTTAYKCINCEGDHQSTGCNLYPKYIPQAKVLRMAYQENVPFPIAAKELANLSKGPSFPRNKEVISNVLPNPWPHPHKNNQNQTQLSPTQISIPLLVNEHPNIIKASPALRNPRFSQTSWSERVAASPNISTQAKTIQDQNGPHMSKLIKYIAFVDQII